MCTSGTVFRGELEQHDRVKVTLSEFLTEVLGASKAKGVNLPELCAM